MKPRAPRGSTLLTALGITLLLALIIFGVLAYTGAEQERSGRSVRDIDAQTCAESAAQFGRKFYGDNFVNWNAMLANPAFTNSAETDWTKWGKDSLGRPSYGRLDGLEVTASRPADFRVTLRDNVDEDEGTATDPLNDSDWQVIVRAECLVSRLALRNTERVESPKVFDKDPYAWHGNVVSDSSQTRRNKVVEIVITHYYEGAYKGQNSGSNTGDHNITR